MRRRYRVYSEREVLRLPDPTWQIHKVLPEGSFSVLYGHSGTGKTFVALDMALSIAEGLDWLHTQPVTPGSVAYIMGEGRGGLKFRLRAWRETHPEHEQLPVNFILEPVDFLDEKAVAEFLNRLPFPPDLIVVDTLARCFGGGDENETKDMNRFVSNVDRVRFETHAAVMVVHHTGYGEDAQTRPRGNSVLEAAADTLLFLKQRSESVRLSCEKQKDADPFAPIDLQMQPIQLSQHSSSLIVTRFSGSMRGRILPGSFQKKK